MVESKDGIKSSTDELYTYITRNSIYRCYLPLTAYPSTLRLLKSARDTVSDPKFCTFAW